MIRGLGDKGPNPLHSFKYKLPSFWTTQLLGWTVYFVVIYITFLTIAQPENFINLLFLKGFRALTGFVLTSIILRPVYRRLANHFSIIGLVLLVLVCAVILGIFWTAIESSYFLLTSATFDLSKYLPRTPRIALDYAMTLSAWSALYLGVTFWREWQTERENALEAATLAQQAQIEMLRYQINPHFLFNTLNSIRASVDEDSARAKKMITQLSEFLRYSLLGESAKKIRLAEEVEAVKNYLAIEKIRFEEKLDVEFEIEREAEDVEVPCFLLNPLVENAVKHGFGTSPKPLRIKISAKIVDGTLVLEVVNSGELNDDSNRTDTGIGLQNVRERLRRLFGANGNFEIKQDGDLVKARISIAERLSHSVSE